MTVAWIRNHALMCAYAVACMSALAQFVALRAIGYVGVNLVTAVFSAIWFVVFLQMWNRSGWWKALGALPGIVLLYASQLLYAWLFYANATGQ